MRHTHEQDENRQFLTLFTSRSGIATPWTVTLEATQGVFTCPTISTRDVSTDLDVYNPIEMSYILITCVFYLFFRFFIVSLTTSYNV